MTWGTFNKKDSLAQVIAKKLQLSEAIVASDYEATSEPSQFGGHRPKVVHKEKGTTMHLSQHAYKKPEDAAKHAKVYLQAYASVGPNHASEQAWKHAQANKAKQYTKEDADQELDTLINEVLSKDQDAGKWIGDFVKSNNPKFAGKSPEKRKQMALAAYYAAQKNESTDYESFVELDEEAALIKRTTQEVGGAAKKIKHDNVKEKQDDQETMEVRNGSEEKFVNAAGVQVTDDPTQQKYDSGTGKVTTATKPSGKGAGSYDAKEKLGKQGVKEAKIQTGAGEEIDTNPQASSEKGTKKKFASFKQTITNTPSC